MSEHVTLKGTVQNYLLSPKGEVDGLMLDGNRQLKVPPHVGKGLPENILPGSHIEVVVRAGVKSTYGQQFLFRSWTHGNLADRAEGKVHDWLVDKEGNLRGLILTDGTQIHLPKHLRKELGPKVQIGADVQVHGHGRKTAFGTALKAEEVVIVE